MYVSQQRSTDDAGTHCCAVEGAVVLGEVQPALRVVGTLASYSDANDVRGAAGQEATIALFCEYSGHPAQLTHDGA